MTRNQYDKVLVLKGDRISRLSLDKKKHKPFRQYFSVIMADEEFFAAAPILGRDDGYTTDFESVEIFSNRTSINSLSDINFKIEENHD